LLWAARLPITSMFVQELGPAHAKEVWGYEIEIVPREEFAAQLKQARSDNSVMADVERETQAFLDRPNLTLQTERKFVLNSFLVWHVCRELLQEKKAFNFGFDKCMGREVIEMLDTPPCLVLALANDSGYTAYCHTDLTHTCPGVLLRWISSKPTFVCNTHFPYNGIMTVAHCAAPMKMNGVSNESVTVMTHYESDYGAATRIHYTLGQTVTVVIPNLNCELAGIPGNNSRDSDTAGLPFTNEYCDGWRLPYVGQGNGRLPCAGRVW